MRPGQGHKNLSSRNVRCDEICLDINVRKISIIWCLYLKLHLHDTTCCQTGLTTGCIVYTAGCQTGCTTRFDNRLNEQWLFVQHGCQTSCRFDNRLYRVYEHSTGCQCGLTTGLTTAWMFVYTIQPIIKPVVYIKPVVQPV